MNKLLSLSAVLGAMLMLASGSALAQGNGHGHGRGHGNGQGQNEQDDGYRGNGHDSGRYERDDDRYDRRYVRDDGPPGLRGDGPPGHAYGHYKNWHDRGRHEGWYRRGGYLPAEYRGTRYVVYDWRRYDLREPPRGYRWVRSDNGDYLLVAIATGVIVDLLLNQ
jgi:Ni/Co efflux regulator RcnB